MKQKLFALSLGFGGLILATDHAFGQQATQCGQRAVVLAQSDTSDTWTITGALPTGVTCLSVAGESSEAATDASPIPGSPA